MARPRKTSWRQKEEDRKTGHFGPYYDVASASIEKYRRKARSAGSLAELSREERQAYGAAVEAAILSKQRSALRGAPRACHPCASGTWHADGRKISAAVREQQRAALQSCQSRNANLTPAQWEEAYAAAMAEKRASQMLDQQAA